MKETLAARQLCGAIGIVIVAVSVYAARDVCGYLRSTPASPVRYEREGSGIAVELAGHPDHDGIYFLRGGATVGDLFSEAGLGAIPECDTSTLLHDGDRIICDAARCGMDTGGMSASTRLALGMPIDLNRATPEDLVLVPGIGRSTAAAIIEIRDKRVRFSRVDELRDIAGVGGRRYERIRGYLYVK